jgi:hypothetical protein
MSALRLRTPTVKEKAHAKDPQTPGQHSESTSIEISLQSVLTLEYLLVALYFASSLETDLSAGTLLGVCFLMGLCTCVLLALTSAAFSYYYSSISDLHLGRCQVLGGLGMLASLSYRGLVHINPPESKSEPAYEFLAGALFCGSGQVLFITEWLKIARSRKNKQRSVVTPPPSIRVVDSVVEKDLLASEESANRRLFVANDQVIRSITTVLTGFETIENYATPRARPRAMHNKNSEFEFEALQMPEYPLDVVDQATSVACSEGCLSVLVIGKTQGVHTVVGLNMPCKGVALTGSMDPAMTTWVNGTQQWRYTNDIERDNVCLVATESLGALTKTSLTEDPLLWYFFAYVPLEEFDGGQDPERLVAGMIDGSIEEEGGFEWDVLGELIKEMASGTGTATAYREAPLDGGS